MGNINDLKNALLQSNTDVLIEAFGVFKRSHKSAVLSSDGRTLVPPQLGWHFCAGVPAVLPNRVERVFIDTAELAAMEAGIQQGNSFEIASLGFFYKMQGCYEFMPYDKELLLANQHFGLQTVHLNQRPPTGHALQLPTAAAAKPKSDLGWLKVAAMILAILSVMTISSQLFYEADWYENKGMALLKIFDDNQDTKPESTSVEEVIFGITKFSDSITRFEETEKQPLNLEGAPVDPGSEIVFEEKPLREASQVKFYATPFASAWQEMGLSDLQIRTESSSTLPVTAESPKLTTVMESSVAAPVSVDLNEQNLAQKELASPVSPAERPLLVDETESDSGSVYVVVGAFGEEGNANRLKEKLLKQGYQVSAMHSIKVGKLYRVVLEAPAGVEVEAFLIDIKKEVNPAAWVLAK